MIAYYKNESEMIFRNHFSLILQRNKILLGGKIMKLSKETKVAPSLLDREVRVRFNDDEENLVLVMRNAPIIKSAVPIKASVASLVTNRRGKDLVATISKLMKKS